MSSFLTNLLKQFSQERDIFEWNFIEGNSVNMSPINHG